TGNVEVRPWAFAGELAQELSGEDGAGLTQLRAVLHVGEVRIDVTAVTRMEREAPSMVPARLRGGVDMRCEFVVVRKPPGVQVAERDRHRAGERRKVDQV